MSNETTLKSLSDEIRETKIAELNKFIDDAHNELIVNVPRNIMPEIVFKEYFLDFFFNIGSYDSSSPLTLKWLEISGGPYNEVDIVDINGKVLFAVPGILSRPIANDERLSNKNFLDIAGTFEQKTNRFETEGLNYLALELQNLPNMITSGSEADVYKWSYIYKYYYGAPAAAVTPTKLAESKALEEMFDYD